jgi:glutaredoxin
VSRITLYGKPGCHLCEDARAVVRRAVEGRDVAVEEVDVTLDPALFAAYGERIPVVDVDGEQAFEYLVDQGDLEKLLDRVDV